MRVTLDIGRSTQGHAFTLPLEVATRASAVHGVRGKGKTVTASVIVEEVRKHGVQVVVIDPTDVWWGLKSSSDGESPGFPTVILGGDHGDLPLDPAAGAAIADFVVDQGASVILSMRHLRKGARRRLVTDFAEQVYHRKGEAANRRPLLLVIDEASQFCPQRVMGDTARMVGAIEDIVRMGRASGFGVLLVDQRPASVNKDVLTQIELLVCHAVTSPQDRKALDDWIKGHDSEGHREEFIEHLASLGRGEAWFWMPATDVFDRVQVRPRETFDSSATPEIGDQPVLPTTVAEIDLDALTEALGEAMEEAVRNDPKALHAEIVRLERELREAQAGARDPDEQAEAFEDELDRRLEAAAVALRRELTGVLTEIRAAVTALEEKAEALSSDIGGVAQLVDQLEVTLEDEEMVGFEAANAEIRPTPVHAEAAPRRPPPPPPYTNGTDPATRDAIGKAGRAILDALATYEGFGLSVVERPALAAMAGYRAGGHFNNSLGSLRSTGLVDYPSGGSVELTDTGRAAAEGRRLRSVRDVHDAWLALMNGPQQKIMAVVLDAYPHAVTRLELAEATGYAEGGHFNNVVGSLRTLGAIEYPAKGTVAASELLFPRGLR